MQAQLTAVELAELRPCPEGDDCGLSRMSHQDAFEKRIATAATRKALWWAVFQLYEDEEFPCGKRLFQLVSNAGIEPWPEAEEATGMATGAELIAAERLRQIQEEGWTQEHDSWHHWEAIAGAGIAYGLSAIAFKEEALKFWPWGDSWWKPKDSLRDLVRAGALIAAAIDRYYQEAQDAR